MQAYCDLDRLLDDYSTTAQTTCRLRGGGRDWALYTAAAGSALALAPAADAAVMYSGVQNITLTRTSGTSSQGAALDLDGDGQLDFALLLLGNTNAAFAFLDNLTSAAVVVTGGNSLLRLSGSITLSTGVPSSAFGTNVGILRYGTQGGSAFGQWPGGNPTATSGFAGVLFGDTGGNLHYGWIRLALRNDVNGVPDQVTAVDWAWQTENLAPIHVGSVPEPSPLALLAGGSAGIAAFRRRRSGS